MINRRQICVARQLGQSPASSLAGVKINGPLPYLRLEPAVKGNLACTSLLGVVRMR